MYVDFGDCVLVQASILSIKVLSDDKARVYLANGDGSDTLEIEAEFEDGDAYEKTDELRQTLDDKAEKRRQKMKKQRMRSGGGGPSLA